MEHTARLPAFDSIQLLQLRSILGKYDELIPSFEDAVHQYHQVPAPGERHRRDAEQHLAAARRLIEASNTFVTEARALTGIPLDLSQAQAAVEAVQPDLRRWQQLE